MRKVTAVGIVLALMLTAGLASAKDRFAVIYMTQNHNPSLFPAECLGTVTIETLPSDNGEPVLWVVRNGNGDNDDDVCPGIDKSQVSLHFKDDVMGTAAMRVLTSVNIMHRGKMTWVIRGTIDPGIPKGAHQYQVFYKGKAAGPDPEIEVACDSCGGGGH